MASGILSDIFENYFLEKLDKQILGKIPYCLLLAFIPSLILYINKILTENLSIRLFSVNFNLIFTFSLILFIEFLIIFLYFTYDVYMRLNEALESIYTNIDWDRFIDKVSGIYEGQTSLIKDIKGKCDNDKFTQNGLFAGIAFTYILFWIFAYIILQFAIPIDIQFILIVILIIYIFQELLKFSPLKDLKKESASSTAGSNLLELYTIDNAVKDNKIKKKTFRLLFHIVARLFGPIIILDEPDFLIDRMIIYWNPETKKIVAEYLNLSSNHLNYYIELWKYQFKYPHQSELKSEDDVINRFFDEPTRTGESMRNFIDQSPVNLFPYLLKSNPNQVQTHPSGDSLTKKTSTKDDEEIINEGGSDVKKEPIPKKISKKLKKYPKGKVLMSKKDSNPEEDEIIDECGPDINMALLQKRMPQRPKKYPKQVIAFKVQNKEIPSKTIGYFIIHSFKGLPNKPIIRPRERNTQFSKFDQTDVFHIFFFGEKSFMSYLKTKFQINSITYPLELLYHEPQDK